MPTIRCSEQKNQSLEDFYKSLIPDKVNTISDVGSPMIKVIGVINEMFQSTVIYGLTSHSTLLLLNEDNSLSPWFVVLNGLATSSSWQSNEYYIEYLMTEDKQPWPNAIIKGATVS